MLTFHPTVQSYTGPWPERNLRVAHTRGKEVAANRKQSACAQEITSFVLP